MTCGPRFPEIVDAVELGAVEGSAMLVATKFIGFDLAAILSSPFTSCMLWDIVCGQLEDLKLLILNRQRR